MKRWPLQSRFFFSQSVLWAGFRKGVWITSVLSQATQTAKRKLTIYLCGMNREMKSSLSDLPKPLLCPAACLGFALQEEGFPIRFVPSRQDPTRKYRKESKGWWGVSESGNPQPCEGQGWQFLSFLCAAWSWRQLPSCIIKRGPVGCQMYWTSSRGEKAAREVWIHSQMLNIMIWGLRVQKGF